MDEEFDAPKASASHQVQKVLGRVHIYGAGIAGLTAAHELASRGFRVRVYDSADEYEAVGRIAGPYRHRMAVGGIARSQFLLVEKGALGNFSQDGQCTTCDEFTYFHKSPGKFTTEAESIAAFANDNGLGEFARRCAIGNGQSPGVIYIRTPPSKDDACIWSRALHANAMHKFLTTPHPLGWALDPRRVIVVDHHTEQLAKRLGAPLRELKDQEGVQLEVVHFLPGEHGFRFFPSYYRHLFSTMVETPLLDVQGNPTGRRVFDNLVPSSFYGIAAQGRRIRFLRRSPSTRLSERMQDLRDLASSGYPPSDMLQFTLRIWRYMCTCSERRQKEYEKISWLDYLEGYEPETKTRRYQYSKEFMRDMQFAPRVLAAFDGAWGDARTNGNTFVQLYLNNLLPLPKTDGTLNGPTTPAWFSPWRRYLEEYLRVEFRSSKLAQLTLEEGRIVPIMKGREDPAEGRKDIGGYECAVKVGPVHYYIVATDAATAEAVTDGLDPIGVIEKLRGFTTMIPPNPRGNEPEQKRQEGVLPGSVPWDRFQTLTGIQFFFPSSVRLAEGYLYFLDAPWGLSAINSQQYWATPPTIDQEGFGAVLSVDIGNWYVREGQTSPSDCSRHEIAHEVWKQIKTATREHNAPLPHARQGEFALPDPAWYHVDRYLRFDTDPATGQVRAVENLAPYLIPIVGDWDRRPGPEPWDPLDFRSEEKKPAADLDPNLWQAPHGGYPVHWGKLVFAGTYLKTFTRMTTMESANESARHAVNAIMDHYLAHHLKPEQARETARGAPPFVPGYDAGGSLTGSPDFRMTPIGEYCRIWNPEEHELAELAPIRELDAKLFAAGLPHLWDLLHLEPLARPLIPPLDPIGGTKALLGLLRTLRDSPLAGIGRALGGLTGIGRPGSR
ncbi:NAD(P)-binding protein [Pyxidicoccus sp. 3LG]